MSDTDILREEAKHNVIVAGVLLAGGNAIDCVKALCQTNKKNLDRLVELEILVPRKIISGNKVFIWRCPEELIPETKMDEVYPMPKTGKTWKKRLVKDE